MQELKSTPQFLHVRPDFSGRFLFNKPLDITDPPSRSFSEVDGAEHPGLSLYGLFTPVQISWGIVPELQNKHCTFLPSTLRGNTLAIYTSRAPSMRCSHPGNNSVLGTLPHKRQALFRKRLFHTNRLRYNAHPKFECHTDFPLSILFYPYGIFVPDTL